MSTRVLREVRERLDAAGLVGSFVVRDLVTGEQVALDPTRRYAAASLVKVPLALAVLERVARGELDPARPVEVLPGTNGPADRAGAPGLGRFRHPATVAVDDLLYLAVALSDSAAADALFALVPPAEVARHLDDLGLGGIAVRHTLAPLVGTAVERLAPEDAHLAHRLATALGTPGGGHPVEQLDVGLASSAAAGALADLLQEVWRPTRVRPEVAARVRTLMGHNVLRQRLAPDFTSDAERWSSKTGTILNQRHEMGVVEHEDGGCLAVVALTESRVAAAAQPGAEAVMGDVARTLHDLLRAG
ncbi:MULTISPECIES: serine hydrolase [unclassified Nocardioides]|uniref:serine hydrolase n=1 Tax=unclassified Nocardioides TaxID=2615069 RepID=UPI002404B8A4|nr:MULTISPECIES: serine hydrolase [unclassified Nocardioides]MDF9717000.1 class A beta-lactamase-related serine hydrolase [Nocardioides sp. ChNu-99]